MAFSTEKQRNVLVFIIFVFALIRLFYFIKYSILSSTMWIVDNITSLAAIVLLFFFYKKIKLTILHFSFIVGFLLLHNFGTIGYYSKDIAWLPFDAWVHGFFGFIAAIIVSSYLEKEKLRFKFVFMLLLVLGMGAFHEIVELLGAVFFGEGDGFLFFGTGDLKSFNSQWDLFSSLIGALIGYFAYRMGRLFYSSSSSSS